MFVGMPVMQRFVKELENKISFTFHSFIFIVTYSFKFKEHLINMLKMGCDQMISQQCDGLRQSLSCNRSVGHLVIEFLS